MRRFTVRSFPVLTLISALAPSFFLDRYLLSIDSAQTEQQLELTCVMSPLFGSAREGTILCVIA